MSKYKSYLTLRNFLFVVALIILCAYAIGYRVTPLGAAKAHFNVDRDAITLGEVDFGWSKVYFFDTDDGPRTVVSLKSLFFWRAPISTYSETLSDDVVTIGILSYSDKKGQFTVFAVKSIDPDVAFIEVGPPNQSVRKEITVNSPLIFSWEEKIDFYDLKAVALSSDAKPLYEYRYLNDTNIIKSEDLKWYPIREE